MSPGGGERGARRAAVVVAGGAARRFGGRDKLRVEVEGVPVLARVLQAVASVDSCDDVVVVGPPRREIHPHVRVVREEPPLSGPAAALAAGLQALQLRSDAVVLVLAGDLPALTGAALHALCRAVEDEPDLDVAVAGDDTLAPQYLLAAWRAGALAAAVERLGDPVDRPVRALYDGARVAVVRLPRGVGEPPPWGDLDEGPAAGGSVSS